MAKLADMSSYQKFVVAILAFLQFTIILDFMILSPLGATLMPTLEITTAQFGWVVSSYAFSAGIAGFLAAGFADRFDRKKLLLFFYTGFIIGTFLCGIATDFQFLLIARIITGLFGGVVGSISFAITTDVFPLELRGRVMGIVQTSFAVSQVLGLPFGLYLSNHWGWHAPFLLIVGIGAFVGLLITLKMRPINAHLAIQAEKTAFQHLVHTVTQPRYLQGFATTALLATGGFLIMPFSSVFSVNNLKISLEQLPMVYMVTGVCSIIAAPLLGRLTDKGGRLNVFFFGSLVAILTVIFYTQMGASPLWLVILVSCVMFVGVSARMISSSATISAVPNAADRGAYMAISSSLQQISGGAAAVIGGLLIIQTSNGPIEHFERLGYVSAATTLVTLFMMYKIDRYVKERLAAAKARGH